MKNYVYIFHLEDPMMTPSEGAMDAWGAWFASLGDKVVDAGNPFNTQAEAEIKNGKITMDPDSACGYTVVKAANLEEAVTMAMTCPLAKDDDCWVRVYETRPM